VLYEPRAPALVFELRPGGTFLVLGEIENHIRNLVRGKFTAEELTSIRDPDDSARTIENVEDLTFGEYLRLLENCERWERLGLQIDRPTFVKELAWLIHQRRES
jgi:hypothetical protein